MGTQHVSFIYTFYYFFLFVSSSCISTNHVCAVDMVPFPFSSFHVPILGFATVEDAGRERELSRAEEQGQPQKETLQRRPFGLG
jgi:hypothetical protein